MMNLSSLVANAREKLDDTYWLIPSAEIVAAMALAFMMLYLDADVRQHSIKNLAFVYAGGSDGARSVLSSIATCIMSVAGTVFSITVAVLTLASQQFGPRLLTNFMRDKGNQMTLGVFLGTFVYSLLILRTVTGGDSGVVPHISVTVAVVLAVVSCGVLVYFIHHLAVSIRASYVITMVAEDLTETALRLFPVNTGHDAPDGSASLPDDFDATGCAVVASEDGYLRLIESESIMSIVTEQDLQLRINVHPGEYIIHGQVLAVAGPAKSVAQRTCERLSGAFRVGRERSRVQDIGASLNQLSEIAVRSLSSNQVPRTAEECLDRLASFLVYLAERKLPAAARYDDQGHLRVLARPYSYDEITNTCFDPIRENALSNSLVLGHLLNVIGRVVSKTEEPAMLNALRRHAELAADAALSNTSNTEQSAWIEMRQRELAQMVGRQLTAGHARA